MDDQYFSRTATWQLMNGRVSVYDSKSPKAPRIITMEPWHEVAFMAADGEHTVDQFVEHMGKQYPTGMPAGLREQIYSIINVLIGEGILALHELPKKLPPYLAEEYFKEPPEVRKTQMEADGYIQPRKIP